MLRRSPSQLVESPAQLWTRRGALVGAAAGAVSAASGAAAAIPVQGARIVRAFPHDPGAFTEGLLYRDGALYESTGLEGRSSIRKVELDSGRVLRRRDLAPAYFGEGIVVWGRTLIQLTWRNGVGFIYDLDSFEPLSTFRYPGEGWALTTDGSRLIMSDGTADLRFLDPRTLAEVGRVTVTADGAPVRNLNELEWVRGQVFANIWMTSRIARIDPTTGRVVGWIELAPLAAAAGVRGSDDVLNGIAYDARRDRLFVTGKLWPRLFQIALTRS